MATSKTSGWVKNLGWLFRLYRGPTAEDRVRRAQAYIEDEEFNEARLELQGVDGEQAAPVRAEALAMLVRVNLAEAIGQARLGNASESREALGRAKLFGATPEEIERVRHWRMEDGDPATPHRVARRG